MRAVSCTLTLILVLLMSLGAPGCSGIHIAGHCTSQANALAEKFALLPSRGSDFSRPFFQEELPGMHYNFTVLVPRTCYLPRSAEKPPQIDSGRSPVVLCEELLTISPAILELAQRLASDGFAVYVPILFGNMREDPNSVWLGVYRPLSFYFGYPAWKANDAAAAERPIVQEVAALCRQIAARHPGKKMGAIGLCITGSFPLELLAEVPMPPIAAPVLSQPSIPIVSSNFARRQSLGMAEEKLRTVQHIIAKRHLTVLGFRFQLDPISPPERFAHLRHLLGPSFIDATLPASDYIYLDHCPPSAHAVLTDGFRPWFNDEHETRGHYAYRQLVWFLKTRLDGARLAAPIYNPNATAKLK